MTVAGTVIFLTAITGMTIGLVIAGVMSMDIIKERDNDANNMVKPAAPPPPSPMAPPGGSRRLFEESVAPNQKLFSFTPDEEKRVLREVQQSMTSHARAAAAAAAK
tara:strand:- start:318 stop:635 length:318 start_codon:yes stop_codon:yes gene_type:complete